MHAGREFRCDVLDDIGLRMSAVKIKPVHQTAPVTRHRRLCPITWCQTRRMHVPAYNISNFLIRPFQQIRTLSLVSLLRILLRRHSAQRRRPNNDNGIHVSVKCSHRRKCAPRIGCGTYPSPHHARRITTTVLTDPFCTFTVASVTRCRSIMHSGFYARQQELL